jgi:hypothetical protein
LNPLLDVANFSALVLGKLEPVQGHAHPNFASNGFQALADFRTVCPDVTADAGTEGMLHGFGFRLLLRGQQFTDRRMGALQDRLRLFGGFLQ